MGGRQSPDIIIAQSGAGLEADIIDSAQGFVESKFILIKNTDIAIDVQSVNWRCGANTDMAAWHDEYTGGGSRYAGSTDIDIARGEGHISEIVPFVIKCGPVSAGE